MRHLVAHVLSLLVVAALALGCGKEPQPGAAGAHSRPAVGMPGDASHHLSEYIDVRRALAAGDLAAARTAAKAFAAQAGAASGSGDPDTSLHARLSRAIAGVEGAKDLGAARRSFGEVSRVVFEMIAGFPEMGRELDAWACAAGAGEGYPKWVQIKGSERLSPYGEDPACGEATALKP